MFILDAKDSGVGGLGAWESAKESKSVSLSVSVSVRVRVGGGWVGGGVACAGRRCQVYVGVPKKVATFQCASCGQVNVAGAIRS